MENTNNYEDCGGPTLADCGSSNESDPLVAIALLESFSSDDEFDSQILEFLGRDEEIDSTVFAKICERVPRNSIKNYVQTTVKNYSEEEFRKHFRISRSLYEDLCQRFSQWKDYKQLRQDKRLSEKEHMLVFLWFAGHETCSFRHLSERFNLSMSTVCLAIQRVIMFLSSLSPQTINWPSEEKKRNSSKFFATKCSFSNAIGCIDGTQIVIDPPKMGRDGYIDRKGNVSICLQGICDENKKFINIFVGYPGSSHYSWVFKKSPIYDALPSYCGDYFLLADLAYPCSEYLVTPYRDNGRLTTAQMQFNMKLSSGRVLIQHAFGMLKQRFRQLHYCKLRGMEKLCHFIRACCVLHNLADEDDLDFHTDLSPESDEVYAEHERISLGNSLRNALCSEVQRNINTSDEIQCEL